MDPEARAAYQREIAEPAEIDWNLAENLFVEGYLVYPEDPDSDDPAVRTWPLMADIARKFGVTPSRVTQKAAQYNWVRRQHLFREEHEKGIQVPPANPAKPLGQEPLQVLNKYLHLFEVAVAERRIRPDAIGDYDKAVRLRQFLIKEGLADSTQKQVVSLDELQARHARARKRQSELDPLAAGVVPEDGSAPPVDYRADTAPTDEPAPEAAPTRSRGRPRKPTPTPEQYSARARKAAATALKRHRKAAGFKASA